MLALLEVFFSVAFPAAEFRQNCRCLSSPEMDAIATSLASFVSNWQAFLQHKTSSCTAFEFHRCRSSGVIALPAKMNAQSLLPYDLSSKKDDLAIIQLLCGSVRTALCSREQRQNRWHSYVCTCIQLLSVAVLPRVKC